MYNFKISKRARRFGRSGKNRGYPKGWPSPLNTVFGVKSRAESGTLALEFPVFSRLCGRDLNR